MSYADKGEEDARQREQLMRTWNWMLPDVVKERQRGH